MGDRRSKKRKQQKSTAEDPLSRVFADCQCCAGDFRLEYGSGKSFLTGQRVLWMKLVHAPSGWKSSVKCGTNKRQVEQDAAKVLQSLLKEFSGGRKST